MKELLFSTVIILLYTAASAQVQVYNEGGYELGGFRILVRYKSANAFSTDSTISTVAFGDLRSNWRNSQYAGPLLYLGRISDNGTGFPSDRAAIMRGPDNLEFRVQEHSFGAAPAIRMVIGENSGDVGIGTVNPRSRLQVSEGDVFIEDIESGVIMKSPNAQCWRLTINNDGSIVTTLIDCP